MVDSSFLGGEPSAIGEGSDFQCICSEQLLTVASLLLSPFGSDASSGLGVAETLQQVLEGLDGVGKMILCHYCTSFYGSPLCCTPLDGSKLQVAFFITGESQFDQESRDPLDGFTELPLWLHHRTP